MLHMLLIWGVKVNGRQCQNHLSTYAGKKTKTEDFKRWDSISESYRLALNQNPAVAKGLSGKRSKCAAKKKEDIHSAWR